jgi:transcriptional regulator with XRE-family HTH domain
MHNKTFGECLREQLESKGIRPAELARRSGVTKQNIGRLLNATPHPITGALPRAEPETVTKLAEGLEWDVDEALLAAGHAPRLPDDRHKLPEGVTVYFDSTSELTDEQKDRIVDVIKTIVAGVRSEQNE